MIEQFVRWTEIVFEVLGVLVMLAGLVVALAGWARDRSYHGFRRRFAQAILLGLEFLVAADIVATVIAELNLRSVAALGLIIIVRTLLSFSLELEATGQLPWQRDGTAREPTH